MNELNKIVEKFQFGNRKEVLEAPLLSQVIEALLGEQPISVQIQNGDFMFYPRTICQYPEKENGKKSIVILGESKGRDLVLGITEIQGKREAAVYMLL